MTREKLITKYAREDEEAVLSSIKSLMSGPQGQRFLWWLLGIGKYGQQPFSANSLNMSFACGEMNVGQQIVAKLIDAGPGVLPRLMEASYNIELSRQQSLSAAPIPSAQNGDYDE